MKINIIKMFHTTNDQINAQFKNNELLFSLCQINKYFKITLLVRVCVSQFPVADGNIHWCNISRK